MSLKLWFMPFVFILLTLSGCSDHDDSEPAPLPVELERIQLEVESTSMPVGVSQTVTATGIYSDGTTESGIDYTWISTYEEFATVDSAGKVTGIDDGRAEIRANKDGIEGKAYINISVITPQSIEITPGYTSVPGGLTVEYEAMALYDDGQYYDVTNDVRWDTADHGVASFLGADSTATTYSTSSETEVTTVDVTFQGVTATTPATLEVTDAKIIDFVITPETTTVVPNGQEILLIATIHYDNDTSWQVAAEWSSEDDEIITHGEHSGYFIGTGVGKTKVHASYEGYSDEIDVEVVHAEFESLEIHSAENSYPVGIDEQFTATAEFIGIEGFDITNQKNSFWTTSDPAVATVSLSGLVYMVSKGPVDISLTFSGQTQTKSITVTTPAVERLEIHPASDYYIAEGQSRQLAVIGYYDNGAIRNITGHRDLVWEVAEFTDSSLTEGGVTQSGKVTNYPTDTPLSTLALVYASIDGASNTSEPVFGATNVLSDNDRTMNFIGPFTDVDMEVLFNTEYNLINVFREDGVTGPENTPFILVSYEEAISLCNDLSYNAHLDYRLPTAAELQEIWVKYDGAEDEVDNKLYTEQKWAIGQNYWTTSKDEQDNYLVVSLQSGETQSIDDNRFDHYVSCVRDIN